MKREKTLSHKYYMLEKINYCGIHSLDQIAPISFFPHNTIELKMTFFILEFNPLKCVLITVSNDT